MRAVTVWALALFAEVYWATADSIKEVSGKAGGSLNIHCRYHNRFLKHNHYWCKMDMDQWCSILVQSSGSQREVKNGRFSIKNNYDSRTLTVTIADLGQTDSGLYWCGAGRNQPHEGYQIKVNAPPKQPTTSSTTRRGHPVVSSTTPPVTSAGLPWTTALSGSTVGGSESSPGSPAAGGLLPPLVAAGLFGLLLLAAVSAWVMLRKRKKHLAGQGAQRDAGTSVSSRPPLDMKENPLYVTEGFYAQVDLVPDYSVIERVPPSTVLDHFYEEIQSQSAAQH